MSNHIFIFGGPRNGSWHYQFARTTMDDTLYSGTESLDMVGDNSRVFGETKYYGTVFREGLDDIYKNLRLESFTQPGNFFETCLLQPTETFFYNLDIIEDAGKYLLVKGFEQSIGLIEATDHTKLYLRRPMKDQWRSYAICQLTKRWQWEKNELTRLEPKPRPGGFGPRRGVIWKSPRIEMGDFDKESAQFDFMKRMYTVLKFYQKHHEAENFVEVPFKSVVEMPAVSPITKTPELDLSDEVQEWITDMTPFDKPLEETDKKHEMLSLNDLESQLWPS